MAETESRASDAGPDRSELPTVSRDLIDSAVRKIVTALVIAGGVIALGIYSRPGPPRYQVIAADGQIVRIDTRSGTVIACEGKTCMTVVRRGQRLEPSLPSMAAPPAPRAALPAPAPTPAQQSAPAGPPSGE